MKLEDILENYLTADFLDTHDWDYLNTDETIEAIKKLIEEVIGHVEEADMSVSFNLMHPVNIDEGAGLEFEEKVIKETGPNSKSPGTEYLFLKKVKVSQATPTELPLKGDNLNQKLDAIAGDVKLALSFIRQLMGKDEDGN